MAASVLAAVVAAGGDVEHDRGRRPVADDVGPVLGGVAQRADPDDRRRHQRQADEEALHRWLRRTGPRSCAMRVVTVQEPVGRHRHRGQPAGERPLGDGAGRGPGEALDDPGDGRQHDAGAHEDGHEHVHLPGLHQPRERHAGLGRALVQPLAAQVLLGDGELREAALGRAKPVAEAPADDGDLGGDEEDPRDQRPVPLPAVQVDEDVAARRQQGGGGDQVADAASGHDVPPVVDDGAGIRRRRRGRRRRTSGCGLRRPRRPWARRAHGRGSPGG